MSNKVCLYERGHFTEPEMCSLWFKISISYNSCRYSFVIASVGFNIDRVTTQHAPKCVENCFDNKVSYNSLYRFKSAVVKPLLNKPTLDYKVLKNFRPISNLTFLSKLIEKVIAERLVSHMQDNGMVEKFQSAYKANHSTETALLRVYVIFQ